jgi:hypothetical protein
VLNLHKEEDRLALSKGDFYWFIKLLTAPCKQIEACPVNFPETAFYRRGVAVEMIKTDAQSHLLVSIKQESKLTQDNIRFTLIQATRDRRKYINRNKVFD